MVFFYLDKRYAEKNIPSQTKPLMRKNRNATQLILFNHFIHHVLVNNDKYNNNFNIYNMKRLKRFNEVLDNDQPHQVSDLTNQQGSATKYDSTDNIIKFEEFSEHRLDGATTITHNAEEKGGDALLTYHHFKVKLPYYEQAVDGKFNPKMAKAHYEDLIDELVEKTGNGMNIEQIEFQELMGEIEVIGELLIKHQELL